MKEFIESWIGIAAIVAGFVILFFRLVKKALDTDRVGW